jgi:hypothetical protein
LHVPTDQSFHQPVPHHTVACDDESSHRAAPPCPAGPPILMSHAGPRPWLSICHAAAGW